MINYNYGVRGLDILIKDDLDKWSDKIQAMKIHTLQFALPLSFPETSKGGDLIDPGLGNIIRRNLSKKDIEIGVLSCYVNLIHPNLIERQKQIEKMKKYLQNAKFFGANIVATETGSVDPEFSFTKENFEEEHFEELIETIKQLLPVAQKCGVKLALEPGVNHPLYSLDKTEELLKIFDYDPALKIILDPANLMLDKNDNLLSIIKDAFMRFNNQIVAVHVKDFAWTPGAKRLIKTVVPGTGEVDIKDVIDLAETFQPYGLVVVIQN